MQARLFVLCFFALIFSLPAQGQQFQDASYFIGDELKDQLLPSGQTLLFSKELYGLRLTKGASINTGRAWDFLQVNGAPELSLQAGELSVFTDALDDELPSNALLSTEMTATMIDAYGDGDKELVRAVQKSTWCGYEIYISDQPFDLVSTDTAYRDDMQLIKSISGEFYDCAHLSYGHPKLKMRTISSPSSMQQELLLGYLKGNQAGEFNLKLEVLSFQETEVSVSDSIDLFLDYTAVGGFKAISFELHTADLNLDGNSEILVAADIPDSTLFWIFEYGEEGLSLALQSSFDIRSTRGNISLVVGDFDKNIAPEIALAIASRSDTQNITELILLRPMDNDQIPGTNALDTLFELQRKTFVQYRDLDNSDRQSQINLVQNDIDQNGKSELILGFMEYYIHDDVSVPSFPRSRFMELNVFQVTEESGFVELADSLPAREWSPGPIPRDFLKVTDLNGDRRPEIVLYFMEGIDENWEYHFQEVLEVYSYSNTLDLVGKHLSDTLEPLLSPSHYTLLAEDLDKDEIRLGIPHYYEESSIQQPLVLLNAPPIHFDVLNGTPIDINGCYNNQDCDFVASYGEQQTSEVVAQTKVHSDWAVSGTLSGGAGGTGASISAALTSTYGESFEQFQGVGKTISISSQVNASVQDLLYATVASYGVYEYPVLRADSVIGHIMTITPEISQNQWFNTNSWTGYDFFQRHEVGNLMSYESFASVLNDPTVDKLVKQQGDGYQIYNNSNYSFSASFTDFQNAGSTHSTNLGVGASTTTTAGKQLFGIGAEISVSVEAEYNREEVSTYETSVENTIDLSVNLGRTQSGLESDYVVTPYFYWSQNGALIIDYSVDPEIEPIGGTPTWWTNNYGLQQDPGLILPWRLHEEKRLTLEDPAKKELSRSLTWDGPANFEAGDTITIYAAIHNFSLLPTEEPIPVSFYLGHPLQSESQRLTNLSGETIVPTDNYLLPRERQLVSFQWIATESLTNLPRLYVYVDPENTMEEIHEENNIGWCIFGNSPLVNSDNPPVPDPVKKGLSTCYPNPFHAEVTIEVALNAPSPIQLQVLDTNGRLLSTLADDTFARGKHRFTFEGSTWPCGIYLYRLMVGDHVETKRIVLQR